MERNMHRFMSKDDYKAAGARHQRDPLGNPTSYRKGVDVSWQAKAFWEGHDAEKAKASSGKLHHAEPTPLAEALARRSNEHFKLWPPAAAEHFRMLAEDLAAEQNLTRMERLNKAITRMHKRYGHLCASTSSSQQAA